VQTRSRLLHAIAWVVIATFGTSNVLAGTVDLATAPLVTGLGKTVAPNIFFILDDSGSMGDAFMPDSAQTNYNNAKPCSRNFGYNTIYYNPTTTYDPPKKADGTSYAAASVIAAYDDGFASSGGPRNLTSTTTVANTAQVAGVALVSNPLTMTAGSTVVTATTSIAHSVTVGSIVTFSGLSTSGGGRTNNLNINGNAMTVTAVTSTTFTFDTLPYNTTRTAATTGTTLFGGSSASYTRAVTTYTTVPNYSYYTHATNPSTCDTDNTYTQVGVPSLSAPQQQNFANWYSFYRTRMLMMKSAAGRAFASVTDKYRVGFTTISEQGTGSAKFLDVAKFDTAQRTAWYAKLYGTTAGGFTPLRGALSKAGRYYAGKLADPSTGVHDPVQYSCQKNFTILTTDGFWNTNNESPTSDSTTPGAAGSNYGPFGIDNVTRVGDQDGASGVLPPFYDNAGAANTLADVAYYYYNTDLRPAGSFGGLTDDGTRINVSYDNVPTTTSDPVAFQHMTTYTLGLGLNGTLSNPGDYDALLSGSKNWPDPIVTTTPASVQDFRRIDDLWHAAVNGHGVSTSGPNKGANMSAKSPDAVVTALTDTLQKISATVGSSSAAATSNLQPVSGDNTAFIAQFETVSWTGDVVARTIDPVTGVIPNTNDWSAQALLDAQTTRNIYTFSTSSGTNGYRKDFNYANLSSEVAAKYFNADGSNPGGKLSQWDALNATQQGNALPSAVVDYVRGVRTNEDTGSLAATDLFRKRSHVLGDIVSAAPVFVRKPPFAYTDYNYATFLAAQSTRAPSVYVGANDGMLHALDGSVGVAGSSGTERWAYIPKAVVPNLYKLAGFDYSTNHRFYVDGPITVGDAYSSSYSSATGWATILVAGLGGGGKGYYALDVTNPASPKVLWEFGTAADYSGDPSYDADLGYSYGNPVITKRHSDGRWVVIFTSGYNNSTGDKKGHLYVVDAFTGATLSKITTGTTNNEDLSGIARISNYVEDGLKNNETQYVYGGDLNGSLWRFDIDANTVQKLGQTSGTAGARPITVQPELAKISAGGYTYTVVYFGTGRYLGPNDLTPSAPSSSVSQGIFAVKDTNTNLGDLTAAGANLVAQTLDDSTSPRTTTDTPVDWALNNGWFVATPVGERFTVDPGLQLGTLVVASNIPETDYCNPAGKSVLYQLSYKNGKVYTTSEFQAQIVGNTQLQLGGSGNSSVSGGKIVIVSVLADGTTMTTDQLNGGGAAGTAVRINWREIE
jgi:type IV pilus assembly protein PilY1